MKGIENIQELTQRQKQINKSSPNPIAIAYQPTSDQPHQLQVDSLSEHIEIVAVLRLIENE